MDNSYLHKKFKKQQCSEPKNHNVQGEKEVTPSVQNKENQNSETALQCSDEVVCSNSVPIHSTNNQSCLNLSTVPTYSSSFVKSSISDVGNLEKSSWSTKENDVVSSQFSNNGISYVISNQNKNMFIKQPSFDTTKINNDYESTLSTSSILENLYSKNNYVTSKLANFIKAEDTSSNVTVDKNYYVENASMGECKNLEEKKDTQEGYPVPIDKGSGGKYVCNYCNLVCSKPSVLQKHIRAHTNERPFPCISCGFSFKTRSNLYKHCRSRTHANRVMGNKAQEITNEMDVDVQIKSDYANHASPQNHHYEEMIAAREEQVENEKRIVQDVKPKPYKPRFKAFFDGVSKENEIESNTKQMELVQAVKTSNPHLLSLHINELIHKNNSIVNSNDAHLLRKRSVDNYYVDNVNNNEYPHHKYSENTYLSNSNSMNNDEPLNLTNKNRKRCLSEITEPIAQKSLIKELLLKNLYADTNKQCPYCKMIFQTVTELDLHKLRSCKGFTKSGARYSRSSSVNVASILTQNKNAFDTNPHVPNTVFPLKSPGPFLGKTRLVESDKAKSFSFDDGIQTTFQSSFQSPHDLLRTSQRYSLSPLTLQSEKTKKPPVKLFGGEVKITHTSGETKSFKIDGKDDSDNNFEYGNKLSENRVVKSTLQSGGTVLQNKPAYNKQDSLRSSPDVIRVYENTSVSPSIDIVNLEKTKFNFERHSQDATDNSCRAEINLSTSENVSSPSYKYTNIMDFSQKAVKLLAPNLKQPNLAIPGLPIPSKFSVPLAVETRTEKPLEVLPMKDTDLRMNISPVPVYTKEVETEKLNDLTPKQTWLDHRVTSEPPQSPKMYGSNVCTPVNLLVNGKVVRYVPGMPGPIVGDAPLDMAYSGNIMATPPRNLRLQKPNIKITPVDTTSFVVENYTMKTSGDLRSVSTLEKNKSPKLEVKVESSPKAGEMRSPKSSSELKLPKMSDAKSPLVKSPNHQLPSSTEAPRKFARPNSLALKPSMSVLKQHHGLTPTMFNQILISPDTPRVAKKYNHQILHGNYFSYLGLKSSTKSVYCTLNKTQPFYVPHFKKLSMYSEWRQQDNKSDKLYVSAYDSRQKQPKFTTAGKTNADLIVHSSYKFTISEIPAAKEEASKNILLGGYETNEEYTYVRGRGRGRYVCDQCGIRCKKPSMLKKHIRTHSNDRPYTCDHCNFSFKTKGNLTKHMKSKAHTKNSAANSSSSNSSAQQSGTPSSDSDTDDSGMDSSDESTRQQEHEAAYGLLSLSQKPASNNMILPQNDRITNLPLQQQNTFSISLVSSETPTSFMDTEQIAHMTKTNYAKNKILDQQTKRNFHPLKFCEVTMNLESEPPPDFEHLTQFLGKSSTNRPLTYPYLSVVPSEKPVQESREWECVTTSTAAPEKNELKSIKQFNVVKRYNTFQDYETESPYKESNKQTNKEEIATVMKSSTCSIPTSNTNTNEKIVFLDSPQNVASDLRKRKVSMDNNFAPKIQRNDSEVIDLSMSSSINEKKLESQDNRNGFIRSNDNASYIVTPEYSRNKLSSKVFIKNKVSKYDLVDVGDEYSQEKLIYVSKGEVGETLASYGEDVNRRDENVDKNVFKNKDMQMENDAHYIVREQTSESPNSFKQVEYDNSAMETLADIATKQVKLEKNSLAKNVATEFLILATKNEYQNRDSNSFVSAGKDVNELIVKSEENKNCTICSKSFIKPSQLRLHMNIHYLERPFRCDSCSVSFRTKGHLQKHERSAGHHNKLSSSPTLSSSEPRPFKCSDCNIAFRIHGHLAKHLRSKMHIMKLECLAKIPFGLYAELERSNSLLTEINTTDGDQCLESLKMLAKKVFINDPNKLNQLGPSSIESVEADS